MTFKAPFALPARFLPDFGYPGGRRFVALYWEPCGDESCFDDGVTSACGLTDNWLFLGLIRRPNVAAWLAGNGIHLGNSDREAVHWLVADGRTGEVYAADRGEARRAVYLQEAPVEGGWLRGSGSANPYSAGFGRPPPVVGRTHLKVILA